MRWVHQVHVDVRQRLPLWVLPIVACIMTCRGVERLEGECKQASCIHASSSCDGHGHVRQCPAVSSEMQHGASNVDHLAGRDPPKLLNPAVSRIGSIAPLPLSLPCAAAAMSLWRDLGAMLRIA